MAAADIGKVEAINGVCRAHVQYRGETGEKHNIRGPRRSSAEDAQKDLDAMRVAAAEFSNRLYINTLSHPQLRKVCFFLFLDDLCWVHGLFVMYCRQSVPACQKRS